MSKYKPDMSDMIPMLLLIPTKTSVSGVLKKTFPNVADGILFFGSFKSFGGTERDVNGVYSIENTANVATWYRPDIKSDCRIVLADSGEVYEIISTPENINMRNQFMTFKVRAIKGGV